VPAFNSKYVNPQHAKRIIDSQFSNKAVPWRRSGSMTTCLCGNSIEQEGPLCARCTALHKLGLDFNATKEDIEASYRTMVKVWHPDRFQNDPKLKEAAEETLKSVNAAHAYLASIPEVEV